VLSVDAWLQARARRLSGLPAAPALVSVDVARLRQLCTRGQACSLRRSGRCPAGVSCPVFPTTEQLPPTTVHDVSRRSLLLGARTAALVGIATAATGGIAAAAGRLFRGNSNPTAGSLNSSQPAGSIQPTQSMRPTQATRSTGTSSPSATRPPSSRKSQKAPGTALVEASKVPVGQGGQFNDPATGNPAWLVHPSTSQFVAFSAVCTHAGCTVNFDAASMQFVCPCHGGTYDARTGRVLAGPPPAPLQAIPVRVINGEVRVD